MAQRIYCIFKFVIQITFAFAHKQNIEHKSQSVEFIKAEGQNHNSSVRQCLGIYDYNNHTIERVLLIPCDLAHAETVENEKGRRRDCVCVCVNECGKEMEREPRLRALLCVASMSAVQLN